MATASELVAHLAAISANSLGEDSPVMVWTRGKALALMSSIELDGVAAPGTDPGQGYRQPEQEGEVKPEVKGNAQDADHDGVAVSLNRPPKKQTARSDTRLSPGLIQPCHVGLDSPRVALAARHRLAGTHHAPVKLNATVAFMLRRTECSQGHMPR